MNADDELERQIEESIAAGVAYKDWLIQYTQDCARQGTAVASGYARLREWNAYQRRIALEKKAASAKPGNGKPLIEADNSASIAKLQLHITGLRIRLEAAKHKVQTIESHWQLAYDELWLKYGIKYVEAQKAAKQPDDKLQDTAPWAVLQEYMQGTPVFSDAELQAMWEAEQGTANSASAADYATRSAEDAQAALQAADMKLYKGNEGEIL